MYIEEERYLSYRPGDIHRNKDLARGRKTIAAGIAATDNELGFHIHISATEGKCVFQAVQWIAPKMTPTRASVITETPKVKSVAFPMEP
jgi:hypothetical protein